MKNFLSRTLFVLALGFGAVSAPALAQDAAVPAPVVVQMQPAAVAEAVVAEAAAPAAVLAEPTSVALPVALDAAAVPVAPVVAAALPLKMDKGDAAFMMLATLLVVFMTIPGLALFYGGLVRSKNMLSVLMQIMSVFCLIVVLWAIYGYSLTFTGEGAFIGTLDKLFLIGIDMNTLSATFTPGVGIPELIFVAFQSTFAGITCALIVGSFAERIKFSAVLLFSVLWFTFSYIPIAHMVWHGTGLLFKDGAIDFAGGTVVHINAAVAGLVGAYMLGKRVGYGREAMPPHSLTLTMVGAAMLWVGWFGFNAGSNLEANGNAGLAFINTLLATAAATLAWSGAEALFKGKASMLGAASGAVAGLVAVTPACGTIGPMGAILLGLMAGVVCLWGVSGLKRMLGADDSLDVFGVHGVGGILGALLVAVFSDATLGGVKAADYSIVTQLIIQLKGVVLTVVWSAVVAAIAYKLVDVMVGLRVTEEAEREGLDISSHGEQAYSK